MTFQDCHMWSVHFMTFQVYHDLYKPWNKSITTDKPWKSQHWCWVCISFYTQRTSLSLRRLHFCFHHLQILWYVSSTTMKWSKVLNLTFTRLSKSPLIFFSGWWCHFKGLFIPVWCKIHPCNSVMSWQLTNRSEWYLTPLPTQHMSIIFSFMNLWYDSNPFRWNKLSEQQIDARPRCLLLA